MQFLFCLCCERSFRLDEVVLRTCPNCNVDNFLEYSSDDIVPSQVVNVFECYCVACDFTFEGSLGTAICGRCFSYNIRNQNTENIVPVDTISLNNEVNQISEHLSIFADHNTGNQIADELMILGRGPVRPFDIHKNRTNHTMFNIFNEFLLESTHPSSDVVNPEGITLSQVVKSNNKRKATTDAVDCSQPKRRNKCNK